jgi:hypothetical protein
VLPDQAVLPDQVVPCLALFDTMKYIGSDVGTVGFGGCMGMSGFLLAVGKKVGAFLIWLPVPRTSVVVPLSWLQRSGLCSQP